MSGTDPNTSTGSPERHGSLEPDDSRLVTGALGGGAVRTPGGADQQQGGERWGGGAQSQSQGGQTQVQGVPQHGPAFTAEEAARGPGAAHGETEPAQSGYGSGQEQGGAGRVDPQGSGIVDQQTQSQGGEDFAQNEAALRAGGQGPAGSSGAGAQASQFDAGGAGQPGGGWEQGSPQATQQGQPYAAQIREHMEVIGADGVHLGTVDKVEGGRIKLTKADSGVGAHQGHHHYIACGLVADIEGNRVRLSATGANAYAMEEEK